MTTILGLDLVAGTDVVTVIMDVDRVDRTVVTDRMVDTERMVVITTTLICHLSPWAHWL